MNFFKLLFFVWYGKAAKKCFVEYKIVKYMKRLRFSEVSVKCFNND